MDLDVLVLVLSTFLYPYDKMVSAIKDTWGKNKEHFRVIYYYSGDEDKFDGTDLYVKTTEGDLLGRTKMAIKYCFEHFKFDYILRVCAGSYIVSEEMFKFLQDKPRERFYCGVDNGGYASGAGYFLSPDVVKIIADNEVPYSGFEPKPGEIHSCDDGSLGVFLRGKGLSVTPARRVDYNDATDILPDQILHVGPHADVLVPGQYHYHVACCPTNGVERTYLLYKKIRCSELFRKAP